MKRLAAFTLVLTIVLSATYGSGVGAQDDTEPTVVALKTRVSEIKATSEARGERLNEQKTRIAELEAQIPTSTAASTVAPTTNPADDTSTVLTPGLELTYFDLIDSSDSGLFVVGETRNTTDVPIDSPTLLFTLYDDQGNVLSTARTNPLFLVIPPGASMPFNGAADDGTLRAADIGLAAPALCTYGSGIVFSTDPAYSDAGLEIRNVDEVVVAPGRFQVTGEVFNGTDSPASAVFVRAAIFGSDGHYAGDVSTGIGTDIPAGRTARFTVDDGVDLLRFPSSLELAGSSYTYDLRVSRDSDIRFSAC